MNNERITHALYDLALASGGHTKVKPLMSGFLQRLLYHTAIPCGVIIRHPGTGQAVDAPLECILESVIGCHTLSDLVDKTLALPAALLVGDSTYISDNSLYAFFNSHCNGTQYVVRLQVAPGVVILLFSPRSELPSWPITQALTPVLRNFGKNLQLCLDNERREKSLSDEIQRRLDAEEKLRHEYGLFTAGPTVMFRCRAEERWPLVYISPNVQQQFGYDKESLIGKSINFADLVHPDDVDLLSTTSLRVAPDGRPYYELEYRLLNAGNEYRWVYDITFPISTDGRNIDYLQGYLLDIHDRRQNEQEMRLMATAFETNEAIAITDAEARFIKVNKAFSDITGYSASEAMGKTPSILRSGRHDRAFYIGMWERLRHNGTWDGEIWNRRKNGEIYPEWLSITQLHDNLGNVSGYVAHFADISELKKQSDHIEMMAAEERTLAMLLQISIDESDVDDYLNAVLETLMNAVPWLQILPQSVAFLLEHDEDNTPHLRMHGHYGIETELIRTCSTVNMGQCLCGKAALNNEIVYSPHVDHDHTLTFSHMDDHGHYVVPIRYRGSLLGVYTVYMLPGMKLNEHEVSFLQRVSDVISLGITKRQSDTAMLSAKETAERSSSAKSEFLSHMSHELRTPLNAILGFGQLLEIDTQDAGQLDNVHEILRAGRHLLELINEVLDLSKVESGHLSLSMEDVDLVPLLDECLSLSTAIASNYAVTISYTPPRSPLMVHADRTRLKQVMLNLLSNAIKYNRHHGTVAVNVDHTTEALLRITITDTGPGIPEDMHHQLFQPFSRLGAEKSAIEGTGIGLAISKRIIELMNGSIGYAPARSGGSCFWIELPYTTETNALVPDHGTHAGQSDDNHANTTADFSVLYIEDNPANLRLVSHLIAHRPNIRLLTAHEPYLGIDIAASHRPDLILLDINLPGLDGYEVIERLKSIDDIKHTPVIAITANAMPSDIHKGMRHGFADYLTKPLDIARFYAVIDAYAMAAAPTPP